VDLADRMSFRVTDPPPAPSRPLTAEEEAVQVFFYLSTYKDMSTQKAIDEEQFQLKNIEIPTNFWYLIYYRRRLTRSNSG
jgi:hypothetical protein